MVVVNPVSGHVLKVFPYLVAALIWMTILGVTVPSCARCVSMSSARA